jgi:precorrin-2 dehydrogenase/sirohydrochlorin ferrochelatase
VEYCDFIFPSVIKKGDFLLSFSTFGSSPAFSKHIKIYFEKLIPDNIEDFLKTMRQLRCKIPKGKKRMAKFDKMAREFIENNFKH